MRTIANVTAGFICPWQKKSIAYDSEAIASPNVSATCRTQADPGSLVIEMAAPQPMPTSIMTPTASAAASFRSTEAFGSGAGVGSSPKVDFLNDGSASLGF